MEIGNFEYKYALEINQSSWMHDSSEDESSFEDEVVNEDHSSILSTKEPVMVSAKEMDKRSEEIMHELMKAKIIFEPELNGSLFPMPDKVPTKSEPIRMKEPMFKGYKSHTLLQTSILAKNEDKGEPLQKKLGEAAINGSLSEKTEQTSTIEMKEDNGHPLLKQIPEAAVNGNLSEKSESICNRPKSNRKSNKKSFRMSPMVMKQNEWRPVESQKPFSVKLDEFPAL